MVHLLTLTLTTLLLLLLLLSTAKAAPKTDIPGREEEDVDKTPAGVLPRADVSTDGTLMCGTFVTGSKSQSIGLVADLRAGGKLTGKSFDVKAGACHRAHC